MSGRQVMVGGGAAAESGALGVPRESDALEADALEADALEAAESGTVPILPNRDDQSQVAGIKRALRFLTQQSSQQATNLVALNEESIVAVGGTDHFER